MADSPTLRDQTPRGFQFQLDFSCQHLAVRASHSAILIATAIRFEGPRPLVPRLGLASLYYLKEDSDKRDTEETRHRLPLE
jgi:hypothetical protein